MDQIIDLWPSVPELARDMGVEYITARKWKERGHIPASRWKRLLEAASERGIDLSHADLIEAVAEVA